MRRLGLCTAVSALFCLTYWSPASAASQSCLDEVGAVSASWAAVQAENAGDEEPATITVDTDEGLTEVPVEDAGPTENWFGRPPEAEVVERDLTAAREAAERGDDEACHEHLNNVKSLLEDG